METSSISGSRWTTLMPVDQRAENHLADLRGCPSPVAGREHQLDSLALVIQKLARDTAVSRAWPSPLKVPRCQQQMALVWAEAGQQLSAGFPQDHIVPLHLTHFTQEVPCDPQCFSLDWEFLIPCKIRGSAPLTFYLVPHPTPFNLLIKLIRTRTCKRFHPRALAFKALNSNESFTRQCWTFQSDGMKEVRDDPKREYKGMQ